MSNVYKSSLSGGGAGDDAKAYHTDDPTVTFIDDSDYVPILVRGSTPRKTIWSGIKSVLTNTFQPKLTAGNNIEITNQNVLNAQMPVIGTFSKSDLYDTTEKVIGKWTDGRPLYQKSYTGRLSTSNIDTVIDSSFSFDLVESDGAIYNGSEHIPVNFSTDNDNYSVCFRFEGTTHLGIQVASAYKGYYYRVTVRYTKPSDAANSYNYSDENDYSTNEHVIGTWVDGSLLYQRTYTGTMSNSSNDVAIASSFTYSVKETKGMIYKNGDYLPVNFGSDRNDIWSVCYVDQMTDSASKNTLRLGVGESYKGYNYWVTVKYTK